MIEVTVQRKKGKVVVGPVPIVVGGGQGEMDLTEARRGAANRGFNGPPMKGVLMNRTFVKSPEVERRKVGPPDGRRWRCGQIGDLLTQLEAEAIALGEECRIRDGIC